LLEAGELADPELQDMADLGIQAFAGWLERAGIAALDDQRIARLMEGLTEVERLRSDAGSVTSGEPA
jgi:hypothetical protein